MQELRVICEPCHLYKLDVDIETRLYRAALARVYHKLYPSKDGKLTAEFLFEVRGVFNELKQEAYRG